MFEICTANGILGLFKQRVFCILKSHSYWVYWKVGRQLCGVWFDISGPCHRHVTRILLRRLLAQQMAGTVNTLVTKHQFTRRAIILFDLQHLSYPQDNLYQSTSLLTFQGITGYYFRQKKPSTLFIFKGTKSYCQERYY